MSILSAGNDGNCDQRTRMSASGRKRMWPETRPGPGQHQQLIRLWSTSNGFVAQPGRNTQPLKGGTKLQPSRVPDDHFESGGDSALGPPTERWLPQSRRKISHGQYPTSNHGIGGGFS